jgi:predicted DNA-binding transcriptional regulator AlpA
MTQLCEPISETSKNLDAANGRAALLLNDREVVGLLGGGVSTRSIWRWVQRRLFPQPIRIGGRTLWRRRDVERFVLEADGCVKKFNRIRRGVD